MGLVGGKWSFARGLGPPSTATIAAALARATGLRVTCRDANKPCDERIDVATIDESLFDIERDADSLLLHSFIPAHPYLWENVDRVLEELGGRVELRDVYWRPQERFTHLRRPWPELSRRQQLLLQLPTIGAWRWLDRFA
jgi:hypothetical protein